MLGNPGAKASRVVSAPRSRFSRPRLAIKVAFKIRLPASCVSPPPYFSCSPFPLLRLSCFTFRLKISCSPSYYFIHLHTLCSILRCDLSSSHFASSVLPPSHLLHFIFNSYFIILLLLLFFFSYIYFFISLYLKTASNNHHNIYSRAYRKKSLVLNFGSKELRSSYQVKPIQRKRLKMKPTKKLIRESRWKKSRLECDISK